VLKNIRVENKAAVKANANVQAAVEAVAEELGKSGRILLRESGTEPVIRVMVEAKTELLCEQMVDRVIEVIINEGLAPKAGK
jgi:phosphoglucosamine mutase